MHLSNITLGKKLKQVFKVKGNAFGKNGYLCTVRCPHRVCLVQITLLILKIKVKTEKTIVKSVKEDEIRVPSSTDCI